MKRLSINIIPGILLVILALQSCSTTKHLPEGEVLYIGTRRINYEKVGENKKEWKINDYAEKSKDVLMTLFVNPNGAFAGLPFMRFLPFRLYFYNWFYTEKDSSLRHWMMINFGEPPVTISSVNPGLRIKYIENQLYNKGHFGVEGNFELKYRGEKKAFIRYSFSIPEAYTYRTIEIKLDSAQEELRTAINDYMEYSKIIPGNDFNLDDIAEEKKLLWEYFQNQGYFHIKKNHIIILADTTAGNKQVDLQYRIDNDLTANHFKKVRIRENSVKIDNMPVGLSGERAYSIGGVSIKQRLLDKIIEINKDSLYSLENTKATIRNVSDIGIFREPIIRYTPRPDDSSELVADIELNTADLHSYGLTSEITQKNTGYIGPGIGLFATRRNLFGGAENLNLILDGYLDFPYGVFSENSSRSSGFSARASLNTPIIKSPLWFIRKKAVTLPKRQITVGFELNNRADYFSIVEWKGSYNLSWNTSARTNHELGLLNINYSNILSSTPEFDTLFDQNELVRYSIRSQFITGPSYTFTYNNTADEFKRVKSYYQADLELAGNLFNAANLLMGNTGKDKKLMGVEFSQYIRFVSDFRVYVNIGNRDSQIAFRNLIGIGRAYGNSSYMPYVRQFYIGGSNSLRPIAARTVGPGRYLEFDEKSINQVGDIKFENNLEFRFRIAYILYGALWGDIGNIWLWEEDPDRPRTTIRFDKILVDSYFTSGAGLRIDLKYLILRLDYGAVVYFPVLIPGYKWIWQNKLPLHGLVFGIGHAF